MSMQNNHLEAKYIIPLVVGVIFNITTATLLSLWCIQRADFIINRYDTNNIKTQVLISLADDVTFDKAEKWLKRHKAKVIWLNSSAYKIYLVCTSNEAV